jgi:hypothetical protein
MIDLVEILKIVGSLSGLFATAFLLWDRYSKHFPVAIIVAQPIIPGSVNIAHRLYLKNVSDRPILISWEHGGMNQLRVAKDHSAHGILRSQQGKDHRISRRRYRGLSADTEAEQLQRDRPGQ